MDEDRLRKLEGREGRLRTLFELFLSSHHHKTNQFLSYVRHLAHDSVYERNQEQDILSWYYIFSGWLYEN